MAMDSSLWEVCRPEKPVESQCRDFLGPTPPPYQAISSAKMEQTTCSHTRTLTISLSPEPLPRISAGECRRAGHWQWLILFPLVVLVSLAKAHISCMAGPSSPCSSLGLGVRKDPRG